MCHYLQVWGGGGGGGVDSVKSTVTVFLEVNFPEEGGGFDWRGCFLSEDTTLYGGGVRFDL